MLDKHTTMTVYAQSKISAAGSSRLVHGNRTSTSDDPCRWESGKDTQFQQHEGDDEEREADEEERQAQEARDKPRWKSALRGCPGWEERVDVRALIGPLGEFLMQAATTSRVSATSRSMCCKIGHASGLTSMTQDPQRCALETPPEGIIRHIQSFSPDKRYNETKHAKNKELPALMDAPRGRDSPKHRALW